MKSFNTFALSCIAIVTFAALTFAVPQDASTQSFDVVANVVKQSSSADEKTETASRKELRRSLIKAIRMARGKGEITGRQAVRIRVASLSPAFMENVEDLAIVQIASSGVESEDVPVDDDGRVIRASINWEGLIAFLEALLPLILQLIDALG